MVDRLASPYRFKNIENKTNILSTEKNGIVRYPELDIMWQRAVAKLGKHMTLGARMTLLVTHKFGEKDDRIIKWGNRDLLDI